MRVKISRVRFREETKLTDHGIVIFDFEYFRLYCRCFYAYIAIIWLTELSIDPLNE